MNTSEWRQAPLLWAVCSRSGRRCTRTMGLGGTCGCLWAKMMTHSFSIFISNLWLPLGKKEYHLRICGVLLPGEKDTCNVYSLFSAWDTCVPFLSIYSAHKQGKKEERAKESHFLLIFEESKSVRRYVGHWSDPLLETKTKLNPLNRNLFQWVLEILTNTSSICICTVSNTDWFSVLFW